MYRLLSIDSSTTQTGIAIFDNGVFKGYELLDCSNDKNMDSRFKLMAQTLLEILNQYSPNAIYVEETVVVRNAKTQRFLTRLQGVLYGWCVMRECDFNTIRPSEWRKPLKFNQGKNIKREMLKQQSIDYVKEHYGLNVDDNIADAICIGEAIFKIFDNQ